jgi:Xaa-Pro aminopeptidase
VITEKQLKAGVAAADVAKGYYQYFVDHGYKDNFVYGPMHGTGMIEVEAPWVETSSDYTFKPNMTFQIDSFIATDEFGVRWEKGIAIREDGVEVLTQPIGELYELDF